jgi:hypothetical protein
VGTAVRAIQDAVPRANVRGIAADLGTAAGCAAVVEHAREIDILVNVGIGGARDRPQDRGARVLRDGVAIVTAQAVRDRMRWRR